MKKKAIKKFPSPTGVLYLLISVGYVAQGSDESVSVPYWGSLSSNNNEKNVTVEIKKKVSVPYWGSLSSNSCINTDRPDIFCKWFPSPTGVLYLLIRVGVTDIR